eukprot:2639564-Amphidinium_carterae.1
MQDQKPATQCNYSLWSRKRSGQTCEDYPPGPVLLGWKLEGLQELPIHLCAVLVPMIEFEARAPHLLETAQRLISPRWA